MAEGGSLAGSVLLASDMDYDFPCTFCQKNNKNSEAAWCCNSCCKLLCDSCKVSHYQLYNSHTVLGKDDCDKWSVPSLSDHCKQHHGKPLDLYCHKHEDFACDVCVSTKHRKCTKVQQVSEASKGVFQSQELTEVLQSMSKLLNQLNTLNQKKASNKTKLHQQAQQIRASITTLRQKLDKLLDVLEKNTTQVLDSLLSHLDNDINTDLKTCQFFESEITKLSNNINSKGKTDESSAFRDLKRLKETWTDAETFLNDTNSNDLTLTFNPNQEIEELLTPLDSFGEVASNLKDLKRTPTNSTLVTSTSTSSNTSSSKTSSSKNTSSTTNSHRTSSCKTSASTPSSSKASSSTTINSSKATLTNSNSSETSLSPNDTPSLDHIYKVENIKMYDVRENDDEITPFINGICVLPDGDIVIADYKNKNLKLLDNAYNVVDKINLPATPQDLCHITDNEVAVTIWDDSKPDGEIQIINIVRGKLTRKRTIQLDHPCLGISHHNGQLYVCGGRFDGLYMYNMKGVKKQKLYEGKACDVAVNSEEQLIYLAGGLDGLIVLDINGKVVPKLTDEEVGYLSHVAIVGNGTVFVGGCLSQSVIQVDREGKKKLATLVDKADNLGYVGSLCVNYKTDELIIGHNTNELSVIKLK